jgi:hypothetical protein
MPDRTPARPAAAANDTRPRILHTMGSVETGTPTNVLANRHEVLWPDGSSIGFHPVLQDDQQPLWLRAVHHAGLWLLFDMRALDRRTAEALAVTHWRERPGVLMYGLRAAFSNAPQCMRVIQAEALATCPGADRPAQPARRGAAA